jgi:hypothetical protein
MNGLYIIVGIVLIILGIWQSIVKAKNIARGRQSILGSDIQLLIIGIVLVICGVILILQHI